MSHLLAVASPPGGGKSALLAELVTRIPQASAIHYDDYQQVTERPMDEVVAWLDDGASLDFIEVPLLVEHLQSLKRGEAVRNPDSGDWIQPAPVLLLETPMGRAHAPTGRLIDSLVWLDLPLDLALARKLGSFIDDFHLAPDDELRDCLGWLGGYLGDYCRGTHRALALQQRLVRETAVDLYLDATLPLSQLSAQVIAFLQPRLDAAHG